MLKIKSIQFRILFSFALLIVFAAMMLIWVSYSVSARSIKDSRMKVVGGVASMKRKLLDGLLAAQHEKAGETLVSLAKNCFQKGAGLNQACVNNTLQTYFGKEDALGVLLIHPVTHYRFSLGMPQGLDVGAEFKQGQLAEFISIDGGKDSRPYLIKARDDESGYRLVTLYPNKVIAGLFDVPENLGNTGETFLADPSGYFITQSRYPSSQGHSHPISANPMRICLTSGDGEMLALDYRDEPVIHGFRFVPEIGGGCIMAHITQAEAFGVIDSLKWKLALVAIGCILLSLTVAAYLSRIIARPIVNITRVARAIADGDLSAVATMETQDEIGDLALSFNFMINNLNAILTNLRTRDTELLESKKVLESRVAESTRELNDALNLLEKSAAISGAISKIAPVGHIVADSTGTIISTNPAAERMFGYAAGELPGKNVTVLAPTSKEDEYSKYIREYTDFKKTGLPDKRNTIRVPKELLAIKQNGEFFYISLYVKEVLLSGEFVFIGIMEDITERREAKIALTEAVENSDAIMNASNETLALIGLEGNLIAINEAGAKRLNAHRADLVGKSLFQILPLELAMNRLKRFEEVARTGQSLEFEDERAGRFLSNSVYPVIDKNGNVTRVALFAVDITERKQWERALAEREAKMRAILVSVPDAIILIDEKGIVEMFNPAGARIFGWAAEDVIDQNVKILMPEPYQSGHDRYLGNYLHSGEKKIIGNLREVAGLRKDGSSFPAELYVTELWLGQTRKYLGIVRDISERKLAEEALKKSGESLRESYLKYSAIMDHVTSVIYTLSAEGEPTFINREAEMIMGDCVNECLKKHSLWENLVVKEDMGKYLEFRSNILTSNETRKLQYRIKCMDGSIVWLEDKCSPINDYDGRVVYYQGIVDDITELKKLEQVRDNFFHAVVHDLKSPMTGIKLELGMLDDQITSFSAECATKEASQEIISGYEGSLKQKIADIHEGIDQLHLMIQSLLKLGEIEEEKLELHYEAFAMNGLLGELERDFRGRAAAKGLAMEFRNAFAGTVIADFGLLKRVLQNLVDNAIKYCFANTAITIDASCAKKEGGGENIIISVTNAGQPLTENKMNALFQKFKTLGHEESGSGIGLFFCFKTMNLLGGGIYVDQDAETITFHIFFPNG